MAALLSSDSTLLPGRGPDARSGLCPEGHAILTRARVDTEEPFHIERCASCHGLWLDKGEWNRLSDMGLVGEVDGLFDRPRTAALGFLVRAVNAS